MIKTCDGVAHIKLCKERTNCVYYGNYLTQFVEKTSNFNQVKKDHSKFKTCKKI